MEVERLPRHLAHELEALHRHPGVPEEDDVEAGDEDVVGVMALEVVGLLGPAERRERPQGRGEPGVEHVLVAAQRPLAGLGLARFLLGLGDKDIAVRRRTRPGSGGPHQSWRETHQGWMFSSQLNQVFSQVFGTILDLARCAPPRSPARRASRVDIPLVGQPRLDHHARAVAIGRGMTRSSTSTSAPRPRASRRRACAPRTGRGRAARRGSAVRGLDTAPSHRTC